VGLADMPRLSSGKIDLGALPEPVTSDAIAGPTHIEPRNAVEHQLASIWREVLDIKQFGVTDNFFDLGGNSLLAMQVLARVRRALQVEVSIRSLFDGPTIEALARAVEEAKARGAAPRFPTIVPRPRTETGIELVSAELSKLSPDQIERLLRQLRQGGDPPAERDTSANSKP
jgi:aryl carrier-like protein